MDKLNNKKNPALREIKGDEKKRWRALKQSLALDIIEDFVSTTMEMAEVNLDVLPNPEPKKDSVVRSTKQDSFASSFYAWKRKSSTEARLSKLGIDILLIRRSQQIALKKRIRKQ